MQLQVGAEPLNRVVREGTVRLPGIVDWASNCSTAAAASPAAARTVHSSSIYLPRIASIVLQVSAAAAYMQTGTFDPARTLLLCLAATAIIGWLNLRCAAGLAVIALQQGLAVASAAAAAHPNVKLKPSI